MARIRERVEPVHERETYVTNSTDDGFGVWGIVLAIIAFIVFVWFLLTYVGPNAASRPVDFTPAPKVQQNNSTTVPAVTEEQTSTPEPTATDTPVPTGTDVISPTQ